MQYKPGDKILMEVEFGEYSKQNKSALICIDNGTSQTEFIVDLSVLTSTQEISESVKLENIRELVSFKEELASNQTEDNFNQGITFGLNLAVRTLKESMKEKVTY